MQKRILLVCTILIFGVSATPVSALDDKEPELEWGGHIKLTARALFPRSGTAFESVGLDPNADGTAELRLTNKAFFTDSIYTEVHWETIYAGGETRKDGVHLKRDYPNLYPHGLFYPPDDDRRLFDLTKVIHEDDQSVFYHRLDRAMVAWTPSWGEVRLGRQAITWGHGFTFNPMDLCNPFAPTDLERDYKTGDDMVLAQWPFSDLDVELVYVVRRNPNDGQLDGDQNSLGAKIHVMDSMVEMDLVFARHYEDIVSGVGVVGYAGGAAWRFDVTGTVLDESSRGKSAYLSAVANIDYSWNWLGMNWYGYMEIYYNGLSDDDYGDAFLDSALSQRIARGELFVLGTLYASCHVNVELHPLLNAYLTPIINMKDGSGVLLPRLVYDASDTLRLTLTAAVHWGGDETEYGGYAIPNSEFEEKPPDTVSVWLSWYF